MRSNDAAHCRKQEKGESLEQCNAGLEKFVSREDCEGEQLFRDVFIALMNHEIITKELLSEMRSLCKHMLAKMSITCSTKLKNNQIKSAPELDKSDNYNMRKSHS